MDPIIISSTVLLSCEFMFFIHEDGLFPGRLSIKPGSVAFYVQSSCFHFMVCFLFSIQKRCADSKGTKMGIFFRKQCAWELCKHFSGYIYFVSKTVVFLDISETEWGRLNVKHMYWPVCRHLLELSTHMLHNGFCFCYVFLAEPTTALFKV